MNNRLRKALTSTVVFATTLAMSGITAIAPVQAAASAGDLIKMEGLSSVYYLGGDGKRYVFPNESSYFSWYGDFSGVMTIPQSELESYSLGGNVTVRPGTKLVKITTNPTVYAVEPGGNLRSIISEENAIQLYGANWAQRVIDVPDSFFTNYMTGTALTAGQYPTGTIVSKDGMDYYFDGSNFRKIASTAAFTANRFKTTDVVSAYTGFTMSNMGSEVTGAESTLIDTTSGATGAGVQAGAGTGLSIALSNTPAATTIIADSTASEYPQALIPFTTASFTASADGDVKVTQVKFTRTGVASDSDLGNLYLYDGNTRVAEYTSFSSKVVTFSNSAGLFTVAKGTTKTLTLKGDLARGSTSVSAGKTIGFAVNAAGDITTNGAAVSGTFPVSGNEMSTAQVSDMGHLYFAGASGANGTIPSSVNADEAGKQLWTVNVTADSQDMEVSYLKFTMGGTIATSDISNIKLKVAGTQVGSAQSIASDNTVTFDLSSAPITITSGQTKALSLEGDMTGGSGRTFEFTIQKSSDVVLKDKGYGIYVTPNVNNTTTAFGIVQATSNTTVSSGTITTAVTTDSPTGYIADGATGLTFAKFSFTASGEDVKIDNLSVTASGTGTNEVLANVKLLLDGSQIGTTDSSLTADNNETAAFTFGNTFVVSAGQTRTVTVVADTTGANIASGDTISVSISAGSGNATGQTTQTTLSTTGQTGRTLTVASGTATVTENVAFGDRSATTPSGTVNASDVKIASFVITAGSGEAIDVSQITLKDANGTTQMGDNFQNLKIKNGTTQIGSTIGTLDVSGTQATYTFSPSTAVRVNAGQQYVVDVYADIKSSVQDSATLLSPVIIFDAISATGVNTSTDASDPADDDLQVAYIGANGNLTVTVNPDTTVAQQLVMGATDQVLAKFDLAASASENINITEIYVSDNVSSAATGTIKNLKLYDETGTQIGNTVQFGSTSTTTYANAVFSGLSLAITQNTTKTITLKGDVSTYDAGATSASTHAFGLLVNRGSGSESITATGASSGASITGESLDYSASADADQNGNTMTIYRTKITAAWASDTPSGASTGSAAQTVAKFNVTNSSNVGSYTATIATLNFAISQTGISNTADRAMNIYKDSITAGNLLETTSWLAAGNQNFGNTAVTDAGLTDVTISAGTSKLFIVTLDTTDAGSDDRLSIYLDAGDIVWEDGITSDISTVNSLPLSPMTLTY